MTSSSAPTNVPLRIGIVALTLITALVHLSLNFPDPVFILNGLGYLTLLAALYLPIPQLAPYRNVVRWVLIGYTALTVILWLAIGLRNPIGYITTLDEVVLILLLLLEARRSRF
ncbi:MAG: hypothetical protein QOI57_3275 [Rubrobacteraceae bacterium]|jgi:hypothetical protein|nr:hypothetical protein [Rubrobacteraceae bacterium]